MQIVQKNSPVAMGKPTDTLDSRIMLRFNQTKSFSVHFMMECLGVDFPTLVDLVTPRLSDTMQQNYAKLVTLLNGMINHSDPTSALVNDIRFIKI